MHVQWIIGGCKTMRTYATKRCLRVYQVETRRIWALVSSDDPKSSPFSVVGTGLTAAVHRKHENNQFLFVLFRSFGIGCNKNHKWTILYTIQGLHRWYIHEDLERASLELYVSLFFLSVKSTGFYGSLPSLRDLGVKGSFYLRAFRCAHSSLRPRAALVAYGCTNSLLIFVVLVIARSGIVVISIFLCYLPPLVDCSHHCGFTERKENTAKN